VSPAVGELEPVHEWPDLRTLVAVETIRSTNGSSKTEAEIRYFLTNCDDDPAVRVRAIRRHWSIDNALHWVLDVLFREDDSRVRDRTAARNLALLRKIGRRKKAAWNDDYMLRIIARRAHA
jgi:predicted transposase YbfD/YdcC